MNRIILSKINKINRQRLEALEAIYTEISVRARSMGPLAMGEGAEDARIISDLANAALAIEQAASETYQTLTEELSNEQ